MHILVDADACPKIIKEILYRAAMRTKILTTFVANSRLELPKSEYIKMKKVGAGFDVADNEIVSMAKAGDLVITADIPLAYEAVKKGCTALNPRGKMYNENNIQEILATRDLMGHLRDTGVITGGPGSLSKGDRQAFASHLDKIIMQSM
jgi:uncharacterized protein